ncbi:MAG: hypothetical protein DI528_11835 [Shinella sp.]|nr:MAG: hypothetical protein DI528_11835 [Shinella sp.]
MRGSPCLQGVEKPAAIVLLLIGRFIFRLRPVERSPSRPPVADDVTGIGMFGNGQGVVGYRLTLGSSTE